MSNAIITKQGTPSAPGEVVDTSKAKVVPTSSEVRTEAASREVAEQGKATQAKIGALAKGMTHPVRAKDEAVKAVTGKKPAKKPTLTAAEKKQLKAHTDKLPNFTAKAKAAAGKPAKRETGNAAPRLTAEWLSFKGKDIVVKDHVKTPDGITIEVIGRWTKKTAKGNVPMVTGHIVALPTAASRDTVKGKEQKKGDRLNAVAAEVTHK